MSAELPVVGDTLGGRYELLATLGEGGMSVVFRARDLALRREVAVKLLVPRYLGRPEREQRLLDEGKYLSRLAGTPGIVELLDHGRFADRHGWPYVVTALLRGRALNWQLIKHKFSPIELRELGLGIARVVASCHAAGVVHRDLTPSNVSVEIDPVRVELFDFSHAASLDAPRVSPGDSGRLTGVFDVPGTSGYMGPEQASSAPADAKMDVFSFGVLLYEVITGRNPYPKVSHEEFVELQRRGSLEPPRLQAWIYEIDPGWAALIEDCTKPDPVSRPTMAAVVERITSLDLRAASQVGEEDRTGRVAVAELERARLASSSAHEIGAWGPPPAAALAPDGRSSESEAATAVRPAQAGFGGQTTRFKRPPDLDQEPTGTFERRDSGEATAVWAARGEGAKERETEVGEGPTAIRAVHHEGPGEAKTEVGEGPTAIRAAHREGPGEAKTEVGEGPTAIRAVHREGPGEAKTEVGEGATAIRAVHREEVGEAKTEVGEGPTAIRAVHREGPGEAKTEVGEGATAIRAVYREEVGERKTEVGEGPTAIRAVHREGPGEAKTEVGEGATAIRAVHREEVGEAKTEVGEGPTAVRLVHGGVGGGDGSNEVTAIRHVHGGAGRRAGSGEAAAVRPVHGGAGRDEGEATAVRPVQAQAVGDEPRPAFARVGAKPVAFAHPSEPADDTPAEAPPPLSGSGFRRWLPAVLLLCAGGLGLVAWAMFDAAREQQDDARGDAIMHNRDDGEQREHEAVAEPSRLVPDREDWVVAETGAGDGDEPDPGEPEAPRSKPKSKPKPEPTPKPTPKPTQSDPEPKPVAKPDCEGVEQAAEQAKAKRDWDGVLEHTARRRCWSSNKARLRLRVEALAQAKRWAECLTVGEGHDDPEITRWVKFCAKND